MRDILGSVHLTAALAHLALLRAAREHVADLDARPLLGAITVGPLEARIWGERVEHERWCERAEHWLQLVRRAPPGSMSLLAAYTEAESVVVIVDRQLWWAVRDGADIGAWQSRRADPLDLVPLLTF